MPAFFFPRQKVGYFSNNENLALNTISLKCFLPSIGAIASREESRLHMQVEGRLMQARFIEIHQVFVKE